MPVKPNLKSKAAARTDEAKTDRAKREASSPGKKLIARWEKEFPHLANYMTYRKPEAIALADAALRVRTHGVMLEIGVYQGLTATILLSAARETGAYLYMVDNFAYMWDSFKDKILMGYLKKFEGKWQLNRMASDEFYRVPNRPPAYDFVHIDGDHSVRLVDMDCRMWLPLVNSGGQVVFHDYLRVDKKLIDPMAATFPGLVETIDEHVDRGGWRRVSECNGGGALGQLIVQKTGI